MTTKYKFAKPEFLLMTLGAKDYEYHYRNAISYTTYELDLSAIVKGAKEWIKNNTEYDHKVLFSLSDGNFASIGKFCYILNYGGQFDEKHMQSIHKSLDALYEKAKEQLAENQEEDVPNDQEPTKRVGIQEYLKRRAGEVSEEIDIRIDDFLENSKEHSLKDFNFDEFFSDKDIKSGHYVYISEFYANDLQELREVQKGEDQDLVDAWSHRTKKEITELTNFLMDLHEYCEKMKRKTSSGKRKKRAVDKLKRIEKLEYKEKCGDYKVESINPVKIFGASSLWVFNTKTRKLGHYVAVDQDGLDVSGKSIKNYSAESKECIVMKSAKLDIRKFEGLSENIRCKRFDELKSVKTSLKGRINEHIILLAVEK